MRSTLLPGQQWDVMVDLFFYREPEETKEPGEEDAADYGNEGAQYGQLPAPGGEKFVLTLFCGLLRLADVLRLVCMCQCLILLSLALFDCLTSLVQLSH